MKEQIKEELIQDLIWFLRKDTALVHGACIDIAKALQQKYFLIRKECIKSSKVDSN